MRQVNLADVDQIIANLIDLDVRDIVDDEISIARIREVDDLIGA